MPSSWLRIGFHRLRGDSQAALRRGNKSILGEVEKKGNWDEESAEKSWAQHCKGIIACQSRREGRNFVLGMRLMPNVNLKLGNLRKVGGVEVRRQVPVVYFLVVPGSTLYSRTTAQLPVCHTYAGTCRLCKRLCDLLSIQVHVSRRRTFLDRVQCPKN